MEPSELGRRILGRYLLADAIAAGGMARIHFGRLLGPVGFARTVAIKRLHPHYAKDPEFVAGFLDEARLAARVQHPNVVATLDVVATEGELFLVMDYVDGESLSHLLRRERSRGGRVPPRIVSAVVSHALYGLHAAHEAVGDDGAPLRIVHRDVSPQNILVGTDGVSRVVDFGIAMAARRVQQTEAGRIKGKYGYMAPEQVRGKALDRRADIFSAGVVLWEALAGRILFEDDNPMNVMKQVLEARVPSLRSIHPDLSPSLDALVQRATSRDAAQRFPSAEAMAVALEDTLPPALTREVGQWVKSTVGDVLERRARVLLSLQREASEPDAPASREALARALDSSDATVEYDEPSLPDFTRPDGAVTELTATESTAKVALPSATATTQASKRARSNRVPWVLGGALAGTLLFVAVLLAMTATRREDSPFVLRRGAMSSFHWSPPAASSPLPPVASASTAPPPVRPASRVPSTTRSDCRPPYFVDKDGIKHYKPQCPLGL